MKRFVLAAALAACTNEPAKERVDRLEQRVIDLERSVAVLRHKLDEQRVPGEAFWYCPTGGSGRQVALPFTCRRTREGCETGNWQCVLVTSVWCNRDGEKCFFAVEDCEAASAPRHCVLTGG